MKTIELTRGYTTIVDDEDYERASPHNWNYNQKSGKICANIFRQGKRTTISLPRFLLGITDPGIIIGYVNGDVLDNRKSNLKKLGPRQIVAKTGKRTAPSSSKYKGVSWYKRTGKWYAAIKYHGKQMHLGYFDSEVLAARHYDAAARTLHGDLAYLNFPNNPKPQVMHNSPPKKVGKRKTKTASTTSRFVGVSAKEGRWHCQFKHDGKQFSSYHPSEAEAAYAYDKLAIEHRGVDAVLNFPDHWRRQRQQFE